jgi:hypothetical protein
MAVTKSGTTVIFYVDGVALPAGEYDSFFSFDLPAAVGARGDNMRNSFLGTVDELSIYGRALSPDEIQAIFFAGHGGKCHPPCVPPPSGIISWWPGDGTTTDIIGGNDGTQTGAAGYGAAEVSQGFVFSGSAAGVQVGNPVSLQLQDFSIEGWISRSDPNNVCSDAGDDALFFGFGSGGYGFGLNAAGEPLLTQIDINSLTPGGVFISDTALHHMAVTRSGTTVVFYVDGVALPAGEYDSFFSFDSPAAVGARGDNMRNSFAGTVDELSIYGRALSTDEIQAIFFAGHGGKCHPGG